MNCHDAEELILASGDGALTDEKRTVLEAHIAGCKSCSHFRDATAAASREMRESAAAVNVPDADSEWREIRRRIQAPEPAAPAWARLLPALGVPLAAAAALAIAFIAIPRWTGGADPEVAAGATTTAAPPQDLAQLAWEPHAEFVEVPGSDDSMVVYLDEPSGWLVVWAVEPDAHTGG